MAKNRELYNHASEVLANAFKILESADIKQSGAKDVVAYLRLQTESIHAPEDRVVHWDASQLELLTAHTVALTRAALLVGKEVNRMRLGQRRSIKDFIKEAQHADEYEELRKRRKEEADAYKGSEA
jgi:hypothetical protein